MTLLTRRIITISFFAAFLILAPIILLYTTGFRYNWQKKKINGVGVLALKTYPSTARIYLNNQLQKSTSPLYLNDLNPNIYTVRVELPGYFPWTKNLEVRSRASTLAYDITLFKQTKPKLLVDGTINAYALDRTGEHIAVVRDAQTIEIFSASGEKRDTLYASPKKNLQRVTMTWSASNSYLLIENLISPSASLIIPTDKKRQTRATTELTGKALTNIRFDNTDNESLYGIAGTDLKKISLNPLRVDTLQTNIQSFEITPIGVFALRQTPVGIDVLHFTNRLIIRPTEKLTTLPKGTYTILHGNIRNIIAVANITQNKILLIDAKNTSASFVEFNARTGSFGNGTKNEVFLAAGTDEVNVFDFPNGRSFLLGRYGKAPSVTIPIYNTPYYLLYIDNELRVTELDDRDKRNTVTLLSDPYMNNISTDALSTKIFFTTPDGLFMLEIQ